MEPTVANPRTAVVKPPPDRLAEDQQLAWEASRHPAAFAKLYQQYVQRVYAYHLVRTGDEQDAQDLTSQTFMAALEKIGTYRAEGSLAAWLMMIARHKVIDFYRARRPAVALDAALQVADPLDSPEELSGQRLDLARIHQALQQVPAERAEALLLRVFGGLSAAEIGAVMAKSEAAAKMLVYRAFQDIRAICASDVQEELFNEPR